MNIEQIINEYLNRETNHIDSGKHKVSLAGRCYRMRVWDKQKLAPSNPVDDRMKRVFEVGNIFHNWLQDILENRGLLLLREFDVEDNYRAGRIDAVVNNEGKKILYDFKTVHSRKFHYQDKVDIHYCIQAWTYKQMLENQFDIHIDAVRILYISKDDLCMREIDVKTVEDIDEITTKDWEELLRYEKREPLNIPKQSWECKYCVYQDKCKGGE